MHINLAGTPPTREHLSNAYLVDKLGIAVFMFIAIFAAIMPVINPSEWDVTFACLAAACLVLGLYRVMYLASSEPYDIASNEARARVARWSKHSQVLENYLFALFGQDRLLTNIEYEAIRSHITQLARQAVSRYAPSH